MEKNANYALVGAASLVLFVGLVIFVVWLARLQFNRDYDLYDVVFQGPVRGLSQGGEVHFNGIKVGDVTKIALDRTNPTRVIARIRVTSDVPIRIDSFATLEPQGITGVNYIQITAGTPSKPLLKDTVPNGEVPVIRTQRSALSDLLEGGGTVLTRTIETLDRVNRVLSDQNISTISAALSDTQAVTAELRRRKALVGDLQKAIKDVNVATAQVTRLSSDANEMLNGDGRRALRNVADVTAEAKTTVAKANALLDKVQGPTGEFAGNGLPQLTATLLDLQRTSQTLDRLLRDLQSSPSSVIGKPADAEIKVKP
jgi:phospholipid/cholesterol/gamma-HCH transport system substrate-binding protein